MEEEKAMYIYNDDISFRECSLAKEKDNSKHGNCTNFTEKEEQWKTHYYCNQYGIHLQCTKHPSIEFDIENGIYGKVYLKCPKCNNSIEVDNIDQLLKDCLKKLNYFKLKDYNLIRINDWYYPEIKEKVKTESDYWVTVDVKKDKDQDTIIVIYVGKKDSNEKAQFFVKPEKLQLSNDHKDLDPAKILSKIEVTLKDRKLIQEYDNETNL